MSSTSNIKTSWESVDPPMVHRIMNRYFAVDALDNYSCDVFVIEGVPAAAILFHTTNDSQLTVECIHMNKELLLLFDASESMRTLLDDRYKNIDLSHARGVDAFLTCP